VAFKRSSEVSQLDIFERNSFPWSFRVMSKNAQGGHRCTQVARRLHDGFFSVMNDKSVIAASINWNRRSVLIPSSTAMKTCIWEAHQQVGRSWTKITQELLDSKRPECRTQRRFDSASSKKLTPKEFGAGQDQWTMVSSSTAMVFLSSNGAVLRNHP
jgi:hypothetical protein